MKVLIFNESAISFLSLLFLFDSCLQPQNCAAASRGQIFNLSETSLHGSIKVKQILNIRNVLNEFCGHAYIVA